MSKKKNNKVQSTRLVQKYHIGPKVPDWSKSTILTQKFQLVQKYHIGLKVSYWLKVTIGPLAQKCHVGPKVSEWPKSNSTAAAAVITL